MLKLLVCRTSKLPRRADVTVHGAGEVILIHRDRNFQSMGTAFRLGAVIVAGLLCGGCGTKPKANIQQTLTGWRPVGAFAGRGNSQTESFNIESGQWRIKWATTNENPAGAGTFR